MNSVSTGAAAPVPLPYLALYRACGDDAAAFLQAQLAADVGSLSDGEATFAAYCSPRGQVLALLLAQRRGPDWLLAGEARLLPSVVDRLRRFVLRSEVTLEPLPGRLAGLPGAEGNDDSDDDSDDDSHGDSGGVMTPRGTGLRYRVVDAGTEGSGTDRTTTASTTRDDGTSHSDPTDGNAAAAWRWHELLRGVLWLQPETSERFIPQMLGLDRLGAVSFRKGCFPGQEVVARAKYLGQVKRRPAWVECKTGEPPSAGAECSLYTGDEAAQATVVGVAAHPDGRTLVVTITALDPDAIIDGVDFGGGRIAARRVP